VNSDQHTLNTVTNQVNADHPSDGDKRRPGT
jgi:hypothetical protein